MSSTYKQFRFGGTRHAPSSPFHSKPYHNHSRFNHNAHSNSNSNSNSNSTSLFENTEIVVVKYLTPFKISVAILVVLYLGGSIPPQHKARVMGHIIDFLDTNVNQSSSATQAILVEGSLTSLKDLIDSVSSYSYSSTLRDNDIFNNLLQVLFSINSIDELHTFLTRLPTFVLKADGKHDDEDQKVLQETHALGIKPVKQSSILGSFFIRCFLAFDCLTFDQVTTLFNCLQSFRAPYQVHFDSRRKQKSYGSLVKLEKLRLDPFFGLGFVPDDSAQGLGVLQSLLPKIEPSYCISSETLDSVLESRMASLEQSDGVVLAELNKFLNVLIDNNKALPVSAHYIKYFSSLHEHDYEQAFEHLHRYYDYTMHRHGRAQYHNALFTLATLHAEFESFEESIRAVNEAISVARENKDSPVLTQIHFWLYNFMLLHPDSKVPDTLSSKEQLLNFLKAKSQDTSYTLYSLALQHDALHQLSHCGSLAQALESLYKSSFISVISNSIASATSFCELQASTWSRLGISSMAQLYNDISLDLSQKASSKWPVIQSVIQRAELIFDRGKLLESFKLLESIKAVASESQISYRQWYWNYMLLKLKHRINEGKLDEAEFILERLAPLVNLNYRTRSNHQMYKILLKSKLGQNGEAKSLAWDMLDSIVEENCDIWYHLRLMVIYIDILLETERAAKSMAIVLRLIALAEKASIMVYKLYGIVYICKISCDELQYEDSIKLLNSVMPRVLETEDAQLIAFGYKVLAESMVYLALGTPLPANGKKNLKIFETNFERKPMDMLQKQRLIEKGLAFLNKAGMYFEMIQKWDSVLQVFKMIEKAVEYVDNYNNDNINSTENGATSLTVDGKTHTTRSLLANSKANVERLEELIRQNKKSMSLGTDIVYEDYEMEHMPIMDEDEEEEE